MTREEAIDNLEWLRCEVYNEDSDGSNYAEAIDMAIEALSNQQKWIDEELQNYLIENADLVTCKDCKNRESEFGCPVTWHKSYFDFCSWAERRE